MIFRDINKKPSQWFISTKAQVKDSDIHGLGVFALGEFEKDEIIEASPVIVFHQDAMTESIKDKADIYGNSATEGGCRFVLFDYVFTFNTKAREHCFALGYAGLYNHDSESNAYWRIIKEKKEIQIRAKRKINAGEEITLRYVHPINEKYLWF